MLSSGCDGVDCIFANPLSLQQGFRAVYWSPNAGFPTCRAEAVPQSEGAVPGGGGGVEAPAAAPPLTSKEVLARVRSQMLGDEAEVPWVAVHAFWRNRRSKWRQVSPWSGLDCPTPFIVYPIPKAHVGLNGIIPYT